MSLLTIRKYSHKLTLSKALPFYGCRYRRLAACFFYRPFRGHQTPHRPENA